MSKKNLLITSLLSTLCLLWVVYFLTQGSSSPRFNIDVQVHKDSIKKAALKMDQIKHEISDLELSLEKETGDDREQVRIELEKKRGMLDFLETKIRYLVKEKDSLIRQDELKERKKRNIVFLSVLILFPLWTAILYGGLWLVFIKKVIVSRFLILLTGLVFLLLLLFLKIGILG